MSAVSVDQAFAAVVAAALPPHPETAPLRDALGRVLAESVVATRDQPPFNASAMDGYAVRSEDLAGAHTFRVIGESVAGRGFAAAIGPLQAVRIFTGAPAPAGADQVVVQEEAIRDGDTVTFKPADRPSHVRPQAGDFRAGEALLTPPLRLDPWRIGLIAAAGVAEVRVARPPRVAILATGSELAPAGATPEPHQIYDSGGPALEALIRTWGGLPQRLGLVEDNVPAVQRALTGLDADLLVVIGGASVGDYDLVKPALQGLGLATAFDSVHVRPGKPTWFGAFGEGRRVLGLPGNPASALVCAELFLKPWILASLGLAPEPRLRLAVLAEDLPPNGPREQYLRAVLEDAPDGAIAIRPFPVQDSSLISVFAKATALLRRPVDAAAVSAGDLVAYYPLERF